MPQYRVGLVCNDSRVLPELSNRLKEPWSTIVETEGTYYWSSTHFDALATVAEVDECATRLLPMLNGLVKLHFIDAGELVKAGRIKFIDEQGRELTRVTLSTSARAALTKHQDENLQREARQRWLNIAEKSLAESENSPESRERDFAESANNAYLSGYTARHSLAASHPVIMIPGSTHIKVIYPDNREIAIHPMTLEEAKIFIAHLLTYWLTQKFSIAASCSGEAGS